MAGSERSPASNELALATGDVVCVTVFVAMTENGYSCRYKGSFQNRSATVEGSMAHAINRLTGTCNLLSRSCSS